METVKDHKRERPIPVTIVAVLMGLFSAISLVLTSLLMAGGHSKADLSPSVLIAIMMALSVPDLWRMKRCGYYLLLSALLLSQVYAYYLNKWNFFSALLPAAFVLVLTCYFRRMRN